MIEVIKNIFVGSSSDYENSVKDKIGWHVIQACKEPYHRQAVGYTTRGAPKDHPDYLTARRGVRLILNLVDGENPIYVSNKILDDCLEFIDFSLKTDTKILIHCNWGVSRSPSICFLYLLERGFIREENFWGAEKEFIKLYPQYQPSNGIREKIKQRFEIIKLRDNNEIIHDA